MTVVDGDILRATVSFSSSRGDIWQQVVHYKYSGAGDTDDEVGAKLKIHLDAAYTEMEDEMDNEVASTEIEVWLWDTVLEQWDGIFSDALTTIIGTIAGEVLPNGVAFLVKILTALPRRQGRKFIGGITDGKYNDGGWFATTIVAGGLFIAELFSSQATANGSMQSGLFNEGLLGFIPFRNAGVLNQFASYQRRRRPGVGI